MRISTKGRYGLRVLLDVALHENEGAVSLRDIAQRQDISRKYLWQVVTPLKAAGILRSMRGTQGGYVLACATSDISLLDIVRALEAPESLGENPAPPDTCERGEASVAREAWLQVSARLNDALQEITLRDLVKKQKAIEEARAPVYMI